MSIRVCLHHTTLYQYDRPVTLLPQVVRLRPAPHCRTPILSYSLKIEPEQLFLNWQQDPYSNYLARLVFEGRTRVLRVEVDLIAEMIALNPFDFFIDSAAARYPFAYDPALTVELHPYLEIKEAGPELLRLVQQLRRGTLRTIDYVVDINRQLQQHIRYLIRLEPGVQTCEETLALGSGSCRDSAWLQVQVLRHLGLAARFVSGYLIQLAADEAPIDGPAGPTHDFTDLHAWAEVYLPGAGWVGLDPTSGLLAGEGHLPLACTADPQSAAPITGAYQWDSDPEHQKPDEVDCDFRVAMSVRRVHEPPRVTKPYSEEQWQAIDRLGRLVDDRLERSDVRLTMGGEPTFVSIDDRDGAEWNTTALGPNKRRLADDLLRRLRDRFAPHGLLHFGEGKWYPGESLPRWSFSCYWRRDGLPIWRDPALVAEDRSYEHGPDEADRFMRELAQRLDVDSAHIRAGYEDVWYYLWQERRLPVNVDPLRSKLDDPEERARLARVFDQGLDRVIGQALPLRKEWTGGVSRWVSGPWRLRREHLFLMPGDSPMGLRLPLDALPWLAPEDRDLSDDGDPWRPRPPLPGGRDLGQRYRDLGWDGRRSANGTPAPDPVVRTALCVEPRQGRLLIFMPPVACAADYLELVSAIEATAAELHMPVQIEGYLPPSDPGLVYFRVTPDPGVIEVNVHPAHNWGELVDITQTVYHEVRQARLCAEKFMLDGRHIGTGGGNHFVLGGPTPADSPLLRRPDLLRSLLAYWHNHPSLSYLFSGLFVGPTSQAPRVDEARNDSLYELEIAFQQVPEQGQVPPWLVDRLFRHLLADVSGNTHRAEWCIDKLYSPDQASGRLGLLEFRAFEMPPHQRMSLVQALLCRALVARFWDQPYRARLARWGTELHDRFMLPHFVAQDFRDVLEELRLAGFDFKSEWFAPHYEFRFPRLGSVSRDGLHLELRQAIEPWHVLGEQGAMGATVRYVDSSVERLEVKVRGLADSRHVVICNGRRVPLFPTGTVGEFVAGVRYRAWQPPECLHPTIAIHAPLVFDLVDTWMGRSIGGCTYCVAHPGGKSDERFPVNANEAEGRRIARFIPMGHTAGQLALPPEERHAECPLTLDLRHAAAAAVAAVRDVSRNGSVTAMTSIDRMRGEAIISE